MSEKQPAPESADETTVNLRPGQHDEGGHGGMATRELAAKEEREEAEGEAAGD